ncbi:glutaredoxin family protein [Alkalihalophilus sp. As8PL]|uniref:Glutaredoxin family protein n=1 Tax=Alkalihalophilus sp. As8PL TaxID=3237103 RepID=A0AB39BUX6_9BACI
MGKRVIIYSKDTCYYCTKAKKFLEELGVEYTELNVNQHPKAYKEIRSKTGTKGVPQLVIGEETVVGFNPDLIREKLEG